TPERQPCSRSDGVLFGDPDIKDAPRILRGESVQPDRHEHRGRQPDDSRILIRERDDLVGKDRGPRCAVRDLYGLSRIWIDLADRVESIARVEERGLVPAALLRDDMHDGRCAVVLRLAQRLLERPDVVSVDRTDVLDVEVRVQRLVVAEATEESVQAAAHTPVESASRRAQPTEESLASTVQVAVAAFRAHTVEEACHPADRGSVGAPVVVDDDHQVAIVVIADVVEGLPGHTTGERAVSHDRDDAALLLPGEGEGPGDAIGPTQRTRRVRALHHVVLGLRALWVTREATLLPKAAEILSAREELVHVTLVPGVEDDRVARGVEDAVQSDRQLDNAEVRSQMTACLRDVGDQELSDLRGELHQLILRERIKVTRTVHGFEQSHT